MKCPLDEDLMKTALKILEQVGNSCYKHPPIVQAVL